MYCCGTDIAKYKPEATVIDESGKALLDSISFANTKEGRKKQLAFPEKQSDEPEERIAVLLKQTGGYITAITGIGDALGARGKHHLAAVDAVSRKLCNTVYTILKEDRPGQPVPPKDKKVSKNTEE